jgi:hypothetical protein
MAAQAYKRRAVKICRRQGSWFLDVRKRHFTRFPPEFLSRVDQINTAMRSRRNMLTGETLFAVIGP